jgi:hypothetical protein
MIPNNIPDTIIWRHHRWYLHSYVYGKEKANKIATEIKCKNPQRKLYKKVTHIVNISRDAYEERYAVYWRIQR